MSAHACVLLCFLQKSFKTSNQFSAHDNRDVLASDAEYFGVSHVRVCLFTKVTEFVLHSCTTETCVTIRPNVHSVRANFIF